MNFPILKNICTYYPIPQLINQRKSVSQSSINSTKTQSSSHFKLDSKPHSFTIQNQVKLLIKFQLYFN